MPQRLLSLYQRLLLDRPWISLAVIIGVILLFALRIPELRLEASSDTLVLEGDESLAFYREVGERFGSQSFLVVTYRPLRGDLLDDASLARIDSLRKELLGIENVSSVTSILDVPLLYSPKISFTDIGDELRTLRSEGVDRELARREFLDSPIYRQLILSPDGQETALQVNLRPDTEWEALFDRRELLRQKRSQGFFSAEEERELARVDAEFARQSVLLQDLQRRYIEEVRAILDRYRDEARIHLGGVPMIAVDMIDFVRGDIRTFGVGVALFIVALLAVAFRRPRWVLVPSAICAGVALGMTGFLGAVGWPVTVVSSNFISLVLILTLSLIVHLVVRHRELHAANPQASPMRCCAARCRANSSPRSSPR
jgi:uncharacterized protein